MPSPPAEHVQQARDAGDHARALHLALTTWRATRHPAVAAVVLRCDADARAGHEPPRARRNADFDERWRALADATAPDDDPVAWGWLADTAARQVPIEERMARFAAQQKYGAYLTRLERLRHAAPDPRLAQALLETLRRAPFNVGVDVEAEAMYQPVIDLLIAAGDPRQADPLQDLLDAPTADRLCLRVFLADALPEALDALARVPVREPEDLAAWEALAPDAPAPTTEAVEADLLAAIYADPDDSDTRAVYADVLAERGDARGELIALQLADAGPRRVGKLLRAHRADWLGPDLSRALVNITFEGGFLQTAGLAQNAALTTDGWERAAAAPELQTLRALRKDRGNARHLERFVTSPVCRHVQELDAPNSSFVTKVLLPLRERDFRDLTLLKAPTKGLLRKLAAAPFTHLHTLRTPIDAKHVDRLIDEARELRALRELVVADARWRELDHGVVYRLLRELPDLRRAGVADSPERLRHATCWAERDEDGDVHVTVTAWALDNALDRPCTLLEALPPETTRLTIRRTIRGPDASEEHAGRARRLHPDLAIDIADPEETP